MVLRVLHDAKGKVTGVEYADKSGKIQMQKARAVAVAGNSIESPRLLLNSASNMFKDGLANWSGQVGRNYMRHVTASVYAVFNREVHMYRGTTMAGIVSDESRLDPSRGFVGGYELETLSLGLPFMAAFLELGSWGRDFTFALDRLRANARDGVVNKFGQTHDIKNLFVSDGSQFTTGAAENPLLTIVALAIRQAEYIAKQMASREIQAVLAQRLVTKARATGPFSRHAGRACVDRTR